MSPIVAVIAPGMMGSAVAKRLTSCGAEVRTMLSGRSAATIARARSAGMVDATSAQIADADFILSIVPPGQAVALAESLAPALRSATRKPIYVDCNAINPATVRTIDSIVRETGAIFVDGGIIGPPPEPDSTKTRIYLSGPDALKVTVLEQYGLSMPVQAGPIGAASAMKMSYAGITKGFTALGATMMLAATRAGTADALVAEMKVSQPALLKWLTTQMPKMPSKAYRWVAEMEEIAGFVGADQTGAGFYESAARLFDRVAEDFGGQNTKTAALDAFCEKAK
ncbi:MAG TPA: 6-phosphogluconate dehydrogenase [Acetobacteraceae bacterium]|jgi:L-threonate 2-dehydrogenase|nr:6-phosphogluconate dehydrogenase [Acetobacteraceae bacterium]